ncbi:MAG: GTP-binding protein [Sphingobacteriales bacterium]|nr:MAG: GTP-binding protein [Sphingobacteriales bacterium]
MDLLRFFTAGSVDDGKSTLIGRLLYDTKSIFEDQLRNVEETSEKRGEDYVNLALLTDGLRAEREQGITIDVAYRYFATPNRKFILADCPGHIQYTRNMVTGASNCQLAIILIDARYGVVEQTRRHSFIVSLLGIKHVIVCINKMDLVDYSEKVYNTIKEDYLAFISKVNIPELHFIPVSALLGDNVVNETENMPWYKGANLLYMLENVQTAADFNFVDTRFPVQYVIKPQVLEHQDYRGYAGRVAGGVLKKGDKIIALPSGFSSTIKSIDLFGKELDEAFPPMSVTIRLNDEIDISRGDMLVKQENQPEASQDLDLMLCWLSDKPLQPNGKYILRHTSKEAKCIVKEVLYKVNINTLHRVEGDTSIALNDIGRVKIRCTAPLFYDNYQRNKTTGSIILVDEGTNNTVGAGMLL